MAARSDAVASTAAAERAEHGGVSRVSGEVVDPEFFVGLPLRAGRALRLRSESFVWRQDVHLPLVTNCVESALQFRKSSPSSQISPRPSSGYVTVMSPPPV